MITASEIIREHPLPELEPSTTFSLDRGLGVNIMTPEKHAIYLNDYGIKTEKGNAFTAEKVRQVTGMQKTHWLYHDPLQQNPIDVHADLFTLADQSLTFLNLPSAPDLLIVATTYKPSFSFAAELAREHFLPYHAPEPLNIHYACAGFAKAMEEVYHRSRDGRLRPDAHVVILAPEIYSPHMGKTPYLDFFSDGVAGFSFRLGRDLEILTGIDRSEEFDDEIRTLLCMRQPYDQTSAADDHTIACLPPVPADKHPISMENHALTKWALREIPRTLDMLQEHLDPNLRARIAYAIPHGINGHMPQRLTKISGTEFLSDVDQVGNLSAASIPHTIGWLTRRSVINPHDIVPMIGIGAGGTLVGAVVRFNHVPMINS